MIMIKLSVVNISLGFGVAFNFLAFKITFNLGYLFNFERVIFIAI